MNGPAISLNAHGRLTTAVYAAISVSAIPRSASQAGTAMLSSPMGIPWAAYSAVNAVRRSHLDSAR